jgi:hypothetical protein
MNRLFSCLIVLYIAVASASSSAAEANLDRITTINVSAAAPRDVYESLTRLLGCELAISTEIQKPVTMHLENVTIRTALTALSENLGCRWSVKGNTLHIEPIGTGKPGAAETGDESKFNPMKKWECRTPSNFRFNNASLESITEALGKVCDMDIQFEVSEKNRMLSIDLSSRTLFSALKAVNEQLGPHKATIIITGKPKSGKMKVIMKEYIKKGSPSEKAIENASKPEINKAKSK